MRQLRYVLVDVFTDEAFTGNPLAVFTDARGVPAELMGRIANELNLSETTFILPSEGEGDARVRIFTPRRELPFAGHPVCGTAWVIGRSVPMDQIRLETGVGVIPVALERDGGHLRRAVQQQPRPRFEPFGDVEALFAALQLPPSAAPIELADNGVRTVLVPASLEELGSLAPDLAALARLPADTVCVWAQEHEAVRARVFAPAAGVPEDPATGSAIGPLAVQLVRHGHRPAGAITILQGVELGRPSRLEAEVAPDGDVRLGGSCVVLGRGFLELAV